MADVNLVKSKYTDSDVTSLGELTAADNAKIPGTLQVVGATTLDTGLTVANGGTGASTLTDHGVLVGSGTDAITPLTAGTNGQVLVGSTGADPVFATITDGEGIDTTLGAGTLTIACEDASTSNKGVIEIATTAEDITGTSSSLASTPAGVAAATAILKNPLAFAQGLDLTASATVGGITVATDDDINFGTNNFFVEADVSLPDWTPSAPVTIARKLVGNPTFAGWFLEVTTSSYLRFYIYDNVSSGTSYTSTVAMSLVDGTPHKIRADITRETASTAGSVVFSVDGVQLGSSVAITAVATPPAVSCTADLIIMGTSTTRYAGTVYSIHAGNRAFAPPELLAEYKKGIDFADKYGSQTSIITGTDSTFAGASNWANVDIAAFDSTGDLTITANAAGQYCTLPVANATTVAGKKYRLVYDVANLVSTWTIKDFGGTQTIDTIDVDGTGQSIEFTASTTGGIRIVSVANNSSADIDNVYLYPIGASLALENEGIQRDGWKDSSTNGLNASYPASGYSFLRPIRTDSAEGLLSVTNVSLAADADTTIYTVPTGKRLVLTKAILVVGADAGTSVISIGADGAETDWLPNNTLSALDAANDVAILQPVPNTTPVLVKSYAGGTVIQAKVSSHAGGATNSLSLFGYLY